MPTHYTTDMARLTWAEGYRFGDRSLRKLLAFVTMKLKGQHRVANQQLVRTERLLLVEDGALTPQARGAFSRTEAALAQAGGTFHRVAVSTGQGQAQFPSFAAHELSADGRIIANLLHVQSGGPNETSVTWLVSELTSGLRVATGGTSRKLASPPGSETCYLPGAGGDVLLARHRARLETLGRKSPPRMFDDAGALAFLLANEQRAFDFHVARGVYVPLPGTEVPPGAPPRRA